MEAFPGQFVIGQLFPTRRSGFLNALSLTHREPVTSVGAVPFPLDSPDGLLVGVYGDMSDFTGRDARWPRTVGTVGVGADAETELFPSH